MYKVFISIKTDARRERERGKSQAVARQGKARRRLLVSNRQGGRSAAAAAAANTVTHKAIGGARWRRNPPPLSFLFSSCNLFLPSLATPKMYIYCSVYTTAHAHKYINGAQSKLNRPFSYSSTSLVATACAVLCCNMTPRDDVTMWWLRKMIHLSMMRWCSEPPVSHQ